MKGFFMFLAACLLCLPVLVTALVLIPSDEWDKLNDSVE